MEDLHRVQKTFIHWNQHIVSEYKRSQAFLLVINIFLIISTLALMAVANLYKLPPGASITPLIIGNISFLLVTAINLQVRSYGIETRIINSVHQSLSSLTRNFSASFPEDAEVLQQKNDATYSSLKSANRLASILNLIVISSLFLSFSLLKNTLPQYTTAIVLVASTVVIACLEARYVISRINFQKTKPHIQSQ